VFFLIELGHISQLLFQAISVELFLTKCHN
jgi:hypothetical protein